MCRKPALAATAAISALVIAASLASPALAFGWGKGKAPDASARTGQAAAVAARKDSKAQDVAPASARATPEERTMAARMDPLARSAFWARELSANPSDAEAGVKMAAALRQMGRYDDAKQAVSRVLVSQPDNLEALLEQARNCLAEQQGFYAIEPLRSAQKLQPRDWRAPSLLGLALEQAQRDDEALAAHRQAVALAPANPVALSNLAMFLAGHSAAAEAEQLLRRAAADPAAPMQVRQNLALVLGLQGRIAEAEQLARRDLPPEMVANNLAYLKAATSADGGRNWDALRTPRSN